MTRTAAEFSEPREHDSQASGGPRDTRAVRPLWRHLLAKPSVVLASIVLTLIVLAVVFADLFAPHSPLAQDLSSVFALPTAEHPLGTDDLGRDVLSRILYGGRGTLLGIIQAVAVFLALGISLGLISGLSDGWADRLIARLTEMIMSVPTIIIILVVLTILPGSMTAAMIAAGVLASPLLIRLIRGNTKSLRSELYVKAALASGLTRGQVAIRHILPRLIGPILVQATVFGASAIMIETGLGYLGFGMQMPGPSWGNIVKTASDSINQQPWLLVPAGLTIAITIVCLVLIGDGLRESVTERWSGVQPGRGRRRAVSTTKAAVAEDTPVRNEQLSSEAFSRAALSVRGLTVDVETPERRATLVDDVGFDVFPGRTLCLVGESGSGKSVTALAVLGLTRGPRIAAGRILLSGRDLTALDDRAYRKVRAEKLAFITQDPQASLDPSMRVGAFLMKVIRLHSRRTRREAREHAIGLLSKVGLPDPQGVFRSYPHQLSGGMAQRVVIAASLAGEPSVIIADEPTTALDVTVQAGILELLRELLAGTDTALLLITHNWGVVADLADDVAVMYQGRIVEQSPVADVFRAPQHEFTRRMLDADPTFAPGRDRGRSADGDILLEVHDLAVDYTKVTAKGRRESFRAVEGVSLSLARGRTLGIVGESGSGKSTTGNAIAGLVQASAGSITFNGKAIENASPAERRALTRDIQVIFQDPYGSLNPVKTIEQTLAEPLVAGHGVPRAEAKRRVAEVLARVGLDESASGRYPAQFSGGQRQRIAIARAVVLRPKLIVCDEPVSALDMSIQKQILELLSELQRDLGLSYLFISHDLSVIRSFCDEMLVMHRGRIVEYGTTEDLCERPTEAYTRALLAAAPVADPERQRQRRPVLALQEEDA